MSGLIRLENIVKVYPPSVVAVDDVSVSFDRGEIHAVVGENGAGKSTLMKVLYGLVPRDGGRIFLDGRQVHFRQPAEAIANGIGMVHQEILLVPQYTVWENIVLGQEPTGWFDQTDVKEARRAVGRKIEEFRFNLDPEALAGDISVAARQKVEILKLLYRNVSVLILDEPTAVLTPQEVPQLFTELRRLRDNGHTILFISHRLDEVVSLSDRITVMRRGKKVSTVASAATDRRELARMMVGRDVVLTSQRAAHSPGRAVCEIHDLSFTDSDGLTRLSRVTLTVRAGEIVGVAGVEGNGQLELVNTIIGLSRPDAGQILVNGTDITRLPIIQRRRLISFVPQDQGQDGREPWRLDHGKRDHDAPPAGRPLFPVERAAPQLPIRPELHGKSAGPVLRQHGIEAGSPCLPLWRQPAESGPGPRAPLGEPLRAPGPAHARPRRRIHRVCSPAGAQDTE